MSLQQKNQLTPIQNCSNFIYALEDQFMNVSKQNETNLRFKQEAQFALQIIQKNDYLLKIAQNNPASLKNAIINVGAIGLTLNPVEKKAYLIPRKGEVCVDVSYMGITDIACNLGSIRWVQSIIVHKKDLFKYTGIGKEPIHEYSPFEDRGEIVGVYCVAKTSDGDYLTEIMSMKQIEAIRDRSEQWKRSKSGPWLLDMTEMMKKTPIRRAHKLWPKTKRSIQMDNAISELNRVEGIDFEKEKEEAEAQKLLEVQASIKKQKECATRVREDRKDIVDEISRMAKEACIGKTQQEKGEFMVNTMKIKSFKELDRKNLEELSVVLDSIVNAVNWEGNENGN